MRHTSAQAPSVVDRVLAVLGAFSPDRPALSLSDLSRRAGLPLSTTHRIVGELARRGALERQEDGRYRVGLWLWEVASLSPRGMGLREAAMPFLEDLYEATHENVQLAVLDAPEVVYVERISGRNAVSIMSRAGGRLAAHATGVGLVLLAHAPVDVQEQVLAGPLKTYTPKTIDTADELRRVLADVRRDGFVVSDRQVEMVSLSVAAPVYGPEDSVVAAISIVVPVRGVEPRTLVPAVRAAARGISRNLGAPRALSGGVLVPSCGG
ncbi:DNA-binding IclR family transcriptional regulator [Amycolatopsis bartoniae]|uniref:IclR family transcriptional regulator n=1 Tax=Amycolatopsis bartoniae TaxID=941986 RepID=A0A8H9ISM1_9PSEU|nr:IclR family transcriptional regulator [Amycolatopsis bartoniae]MBB2935259.1 DNA-binding IclR family transcriptional regulator [Amycolatopsis bartoniae]TVT06830.1 IclR family transcriptional regulator [Amycolatopsis bartoniae]GHF55559.1 IclR family transcriptional regulator [Amycolatopsis bartoniae]